MYWTEGSFQSYLFIFILRLVISGLFFFLFLMLFLSSSLQSPSSSLFLTNDLTHLGHPFPTFRWDFFLRCYSSSLFISHPFFLFMLSEVFTVFSNNSSVFYVFGYFSFFRWHFVISQLAVLMTFPLNQRDEIKND